MFSCKGDSIMADSISTGFSSSSQPVGKPFSYYDSSTSKAGLFRELLKDDKALLKKIDAVKGGKKDGYISTKELELAGKSDSFKGNEQRLAQLLQVKFSNDWDLLNGRDDKASFAEFETYGAIFLDDSATVPQTESTNTNSLENMKIQAEAAKPATANDFRSASQALDVLLENDQATLKKMDTLNGKKADSIVDDTDFGVAIKSSKFTDKEKQALVFLHTNGDWKSIKNGKGSASFKDFETYRKETTTAPPEVGLGTVTSVKQAIEILEKDKDAGFKKLDTLDGKKADQTIPKASMALALKSDKFSKEEKAAVSFLLNSGHFDWFDGSGSPNIADLKGSKNAVNNMGITDGQIGDIKQDKEKNCWFLSSLLAVNNTAEGKAAIKKAIVQNTDGTYTVTFPGAPNGESVIVTEAQISNNKNATKDKDVVVLEEAARRFLPDDVSNGGSVSKAMQLLLGSGYTTIGVPTRNSAFFKSPADFKTKLKQTVAETGTSDLIMTFDSDPMKDGSGGAITPKSGNKVKGMHTYKVTHIDFEKNTVDYINPRDSTKKHTMSIDDLTTVATVQVVTKPKAAASESMRSFSKPAVAA
jgi:hypothetical protein